MRYQLLSMSIKFAVGPEVPENVKQQVLHRLYRRCGAGSTTTGVSANGAFGGDAGTLQHRADYLLS